RVRARRSPSRTCGNLWTPETIPPLTHPMATVCPRRPAAPRGATQHPYSRPPGRTERRRGPMAAEEHHDDHGNTVSAWFLTVTWIVAWTVAAVAVILGGSLVMWTGIALGASVVFSVIAG